MRRFVWGQVHEKAARLAFDGSMSDTAVAKEIGINRRTLSRWRKREEWQRLESELWEEWRAERKREQEEEDRKRKEEYRAQEAAWYQARKRRAEERKSLRLQGATGAG